MRKCSTCKLEKDDVGKCRKCKPCNAEYMRQFRLKNQAKVKAYQREYDAAHYQENKEQILESKKEYYQNNKEEILVDRKEYYQENKEQKLEYNKLYYKDNRDQLIANVKTYALKHKDKIKKYSNQYAKNRKKINPMYSVRASISASVNTYLKYKGLSKNNNSISKYLPYTIQELKEHLEKQFEPWMTWKNYGMYRKDTWNDNDTKTWAWQLDHIIPQSTFNYLSMADVEFQKCWALSNLRPYSAKQNLLDKNRIST